MSNVLGARDLDGGFTMIEIMVVTAIIGLTSMLAVPNYTDWNAKYQLGRAAKEIQNQLSLARINAMSRNSVVTVNLTLAGGKVQIAATDASGGTVIQATQMMDSVTGLNPAPAVVAFSPLGTRTGGGGGNLQVQIINTKGLSYSVQVTPRGKVSWCPSAACP